VNELCVFTNMTSAEVAAWVQAGGSLLALGVAFFVVWWQHRAELRSQAARETREAAQYVRSYLGIVALARVTFQPAYDHRHDVAKLDDFTRGRRAAGTSRVQELLDALPLRANVLPHVVLELMQARDAFKEGNEHVDAAVTMATIAAEGIERCHLALESAESSLIREVQRIEIG
jgi:hypothetical protein